jgi:hypothetical protein
VREFVISQLPNAKALCQEANSVLRAGRKGGPPVEPVPGADSGLIGTAIEFVLAAAAGCRRQIRIVEAPTSERHTRRAEALKLAQNELDRAMAERLTARALMRAADCALVCAWFERRSKMPPDVRARYDYREPADGLDGVIRALWASDATRRDLAALIEASIVDTSDLYRARNLYMNPFFALSAALGGAEADLIADGLLVDYKTSRDRSVIGSQDIYQLAGYVLADSLNAYSIHSVAIQALRWRTRWSIDVEEFFDRLSGTRQPVSTWRNSFANLFPAHTRLSVDVAKIAAVAPRRGQTRRPAK